MVQPFRPAAPVSQQRKQHPPPLAEVSAPRVQQPQAPRQRQQARKFKGGGGGQNANPGNGTGPNGHYTNNGNGGGQGQGGQRRKGKQPRRQQVFVGPMDHSYRTANGTSRTIPTSKTITTNFAACRTAASMASRMSSACRRRQRPFAKTQPVRIYFFIEDLFFVAKIQEAARKMGIKVEFAKAEKETLAKITGASEEERASLIVFDLNNLAAKPLTVIPKLKAKLKRGTSIIGFLSHLQGDLKVKAVEAGCDMVMPRSAFSQNLPNLLRRHGLDEELEAMEA